MAKFDFEKKGYSIEQVDNYINTITMKYEQKLAEQKDRLVSLKKENSMLEERIKSFDNKDKQISQALVFAVEKAEQIERSAKKIYELEVKRIRILYQRLLDVIVEIEEFSPQILNYGSISASVLELKDNIIKVIEKDSANMGTGVKDSLKQMGGSYIKNLLNKMNYVVQNAKTEQAQDVSEVEKQVEEDSKKENARLANISKRLQSINGILSGNGKDLEAFLKSDDMRKSPVVKKYSEEKEAEYKFDFDDAMNPKENLDEIMKAFDFYNDEEDDN